MANYNDLKAAINAVIKTNGQQEISGADLNTALNNMITELGAGYQYMGIATPATNPDTPDANVFYLTSEAGTYTNFGGIVINEGEMCALIWNGTWTKQVTGAATADKLNQLGQEVATEVATIQTQVLDGQELETSLVLGYYFNTSGSFTSASEQFGYKFAYVHKDDIIFAKSSYGGAYGGIGLFLAQPIASSIADKVIRQETAVFAAPYDCYVVVSSDYLHLPTLYINRLEADIYNTLPLCAEKINSILEKMVTWHSEDGNLPGYIDSNGVNANTETNWKILYAKVYKGDIINFTGGVSGVYRAGYTDKEPTQGFLLSERIPTDTTSPYIATRNGYFCISEGVDRVSLEVKNKIIDINSIAEDVNEIKSDIEVHPIFPLVPISKINDYYIDKSGHFTQLGSQQVKIYEITEDNKYFISVKSINSYYALCAWFSEIPTVESVPILTIPWAESVDLMQTAPVGANYLAISSYVTDYDNNDLNAFSETTVKYAMNEIQSIISANKYIYKRCLYIGDSISTSNNYKWKKLIEDAYNLYYVRDISGQLAPADGGITVIPPQEESQILAQKSIWYRCAGNRMSIYDFDIISLFGGTNDMVDSSLPIGTINDIPYVDDASGFDEGTVTDVRPETLTFASALMGCIEMLKRDFANKEIIIGTVMPCGGVYGNWTDPVTGLSASEAIANLQVRIANKYALKVIPFYWNVRTSANASNNTFSLDGVHPNLPCALRMRAALAEMLCL